MGHSFAGLVISQVAEDEPAQIKELIFLAATLPHNGDSLLSLTQQDPASHIGKSLTIDKEHGAAIIAKPLLTFPRGLVMVRSNSG